MPPAWRQRLLASGQIKPRRSSHLVESEIITLLIQFHQSHYRDFKAYHKQPVCAHWRAEFPGLVSYQSF